MGASHARRGAVGARQLLSRLEWLGEPLAYWTGSAPGQGDRVAREYRRLPDLLPANLDGHRPGIFAVQTAWLPATSFWPASVNPHLITCERVTAGRLAAASRDLAAAERFPKALPAIVGDAAAWRGRVRERLGVLRQILAAERLLGRDDVQALAVE